ncbi:MAG TPA: hypothetical protein VK654_04265 [Nitrospirota bacterium]|nr:hypothetical protein [Nitrospirota bacterium]
MAVFGAFWGIAGVVLLLASAIYRLAPLAVDALSRDWSLRHWIATLLVVFFMAYAEGYRAFQKAFSPRVAARARYLKDHPNMLHALLAPFFCMAYFHAPRRRRITSISVTAGIVVLVILVRMLEQPWRGIIDGGVVIGLAWGLVSLLVFTYQAFTLSEFPYSPEVPEPSGGTQKLPSPS